LQQHAEVRAGTEAVKTAEECVSQLLDQRETDRQTLTELKQNITRLREERSAARARKSVLEDLESRQEGSVSESKRFWNAHNQPTSRLGIVFREAWPTVLKLISNMHL
jgi:flagellar motility protein MotE (MotC chaperone)